LLAGSAQIAQWDASTVSKLHHCLQLRLLVLQRTQRVHKQYAAKAVFQNGVMPKWKEWLIGTELNPYANVW
jgi:hypothetical protein